MYRRRLLLVPLLGLIGALVPTAVTAAAGPPPVAHQETPVVHADSVVTPGQQTPSTDVPSRTNLVGVQWRGDPHAAFEVQTRDSAGHWHSAGTTSAPDGGADPGSPDARSAQRRLHGRAATDPVFVDHPKAVRLHITAGTASDVRLVSIANPSDPVAPIRGSALPAAGGGVLIALVGLGIARHDRRRTGALLTVAVLLVGVAVLTDGERPAAAASTIPPQPGIITRGQWGADESLRLGNCPNGPDYAPPRLVVVHHTDNPNNYGPGDSAALVRSIYAYHTIGRGYCDIAYNFLVDQYGQIFEGRFGGVDRGVIGAHATGFNTATVGVAMIGTFTTFAPPPATFNALTALLAWKMSVQSINPYVPVPKYGTFVDTIIGHRDAGNITGDTTDCPGDAGYAMLPALRATVKPRVDYQWPGWQGLTGLASAAPAAASWGPGRLDLFVRGANGSIWHDVYNGGPSWYPWENRGGVSLGDPASVSSATNVIDTFVLGADRQIWQLKWDGAWRPWQPLGGILASAPAAASWSSGRLDVFARGVDGALWHRWFGGGAWSPWEPLGGIITGKPAAVSWGPGRIDVFARGVDGAIWHKWWTGAAWSGWGSLGGSFGGDPGASSRGVNRLDVFAPNAADGHLWHRAWTGAGWNAYESLGGVLATTAGSASWDPNRVDVFAEGFDGAIWHRWWAGAWGP